MNLLPLCLIQTVLLFPKLKKLCDKINWQKNNAKIHRYLAIWLL